MVWIWCFRFILSMVFHVLIIYDSKSKFCFNNAFAYSFHVNFVNSSIWVFDIISTFFLLYFAVCIINCILRMCLFYSLMKIIICYLLFFINSLSLSTAKKISWMSPTSHFAFLEMKSMVMFTITCMVTTKTLTGQNVLTSPKS